MSEMLVKFTKYVAGAFLVLGAVWLLLVATDALTAWWLYSWFFQKVHEASGLPDMVSGAIAIWCMAATMLALPTIASSVVWWRRKKGILLIATFASLWFVGMHLISQPSTGHIFNPITGRPQFRYARDPSGKIELFPLGYTYHPRYGTQLETLTPEVAKEHEKQEPTRPVSRVSPDTEDIGKRVAGYVLVAMIVLPTIAALVLSFNPGLIPKRWKWRGEQADAAPVSESIAGTTFHDASGLRIAVIGFKRQNRVCELAVTNAGKAKEIRLELAVDYDSGAWLECWSWDRSWLVDNAGNKHKAVRGGIGAQPSSSRDHAYARVPPETTYRIYIEFEHTASKAQVIQLLRTEIKVEDRWVVLDLHEVPML